MQRTILILYDDVPEAQRALVYIITYRFKNQGVFINFFEKIDIFLNFSVFGTKKRPNDGEKSPQDLANASKM